MTVTVVVGGTSTMLTVTGAVSVWPGKSLNKLERIMSSHVLATSIHLKLKSG